MAYYFDSEFAKWSALTQQQCTGFGAFSPVVYHRVFDLDQYEVVVAVTEDNRLVGVVEVRQKKDFRTAQQKIGSTGYFDVEKFLPE